MKMSRKRIAYDEEYKMSILRDYYSSGMIKNAYAKKHNLPYATFLGWLRSYESENSSLSLQSDQSEEDMANRSKEAIKEENVQLKKRIRELEKALEFSKLETMARDTMLDTAEESFATPTRKKSGAK